MLRAARSLTKSGIVHPPFRGWRGRRTRISGWQSFSGASSLIHFPVNVPHHLFHDWSFPDRWWRVRVDRVTVPSRPTIGWQWIPTVVGWLCSATKPLGGRRWVTSTSPASDAKGMHHLDTWFVRTHSSVRQDAARLVQQNQTHSYTAETKWCRTFQRKPTERESFRDGRSANEEVRVNNN
jgi:hypothetical protein